MKPINAFRIITGVLIVFIFGIIFSSCASTKSKPTQKQGLMLNDKSEYSRNKSQFKGSKAYKGQKKRTKQYGRR